MQSLPIFRTLGPLLLLAGCVYTGMARKFNPALLENEPGWVSVPEDCGPASLSMVISYWGIPVTEAWQRDSFEGFSKEWGMAGNPILVFFPSVGKAPTTSLNGKVSP